MSRSNDVGHFFQTTDSLATTERKTAKAKNKHGDPIKLSSKILAACPGTEPNTIFVAEAAGDVSLVDLETRQTTKIFTAATAPLTCLALQDDNTTLFAGSWDKTIYAIPLLHPSAPAQTLHSHTDFVKTLLFTTLGPSRHPILISGGADARLIIWDLTSLRPLHKLQGHSKAIQALALDEHATPANREHVVLVSASSTRELRRWHVSLSEAWELVDQTIEPHETSVYDVRFDGAGDVWSASADGTARHLVRERGWAADTTLRHPDFVRCVLPVEQVGLVVTGCRDEEVRVWDAGSGELVCRYSGHYEEVSGLVRGEGGREVVSVGLDGTVRRCSLLRGEMKKYEEERAREERGEGEEDVGAEQKGSLLTAEEEAELAELMDDDD